MGDADEGLASNLNVTDSRFLCFQTRTDMTIKGLSAAQCYSAKTGLAVPHVLPLISHVSLADYFITDISVFAIRFMFIPMPGPYEICNLWGEEFF